MHSLGGSLKFSPKMSRTGKLRQKVANPFCNACPVRKTVKSGKTRPRSTTLAHKPALAPHFAHYNFCRVHSSLEDEGDSRQEASKTPPRQKAPKSRHPVCVRCTNVNVRDFAGMLVFNLLCYSPSRSSPSYTFNSQAAMSVNSGRTIVKSSISLRHFNGPHRRLRILGVYSLLARIIQASLTLISARILHRRAIFYTKMERVSEALQFSVIIK